MQEGKVGADYVVDILEASNDYDDSAEGYFEVRVAHQDEHGVALEAEFVYVGDFDDADRPSFDDYEAAKDDPDRVSKFIIKIFPV